MANFVPDRTTTQIGNTSRVSRQGPSHLRSIVDGIVKMPEGRFSFCAMSTAGACATQLRTEAANAVLPRTPDAVCVMAPSNNLTSSRTITEAGEDFAKLLATACSRWPNVFAMDFPPRLTVDPDYQDMMRQEFRRVAARMGVKYTPIAEYFPLKELDLWSRDGVTEPKPSPVVHRRSPPARRVTPRVIVKGEVAKSPQLDPSKWTVFGQGRKRSQHDEPEQSNDALKQAGTVQQEELEESYLPLTPVWFSSAMLVEMDKISPSHLPGPDECTPPVPKRQKQKQRAPASKRTLAKRQGEAAPMVVEVILRPPTSRGTVAVEQQVCALCVKDVLSE
ncbi:Pyrophosphate--fructose 6-phosphate 1-phosphotransferase [Dissostichus eleginoides]|uniref:Pyrophosphate--fructose 6-phosphate 1-phosphotransferase n=1 Tax=Dissostichus eleginoides TaxID=100907 RepID=A0AAD9EXD5_DISEL|nr:Pyrophosphate--fructose 6-phosphate 1-phosphotransferase [Dissostichus eleginoides]